LTPAQWSILAALLAGALVAYVRLGQKKRKPPEAQVGWIAVAMVAGYAIPPTLRGIHAAWGGTMQNLPDLELYVIVGCMCALVLAVAAILKAAS